MSDTIKTTGRRKTSVATIAMNRGSGKIVVNAKDFNDYFANLSLQNTILRPLEIANSMREYDIEVRVSGGGIVGQAEALRLAVSRALVKVNEELRLPLRAENMLTRDPRMKERKKSGQPGARKRFQFSKR